MKYSKWTGFILMAVILAGLLCMFNGCVKPPVASFTADKTEAAVGEIIQFSDQSTGDITSWSWDFGDGTTSNERSPSHAYEEAGRFFVSLVVSNKAGRHFDRLAVTILASPADTPPAGTLPKDAPIKDTPVTVNIPALTISRMEMCSGPIARDECIQKSDATYYQNDYVSIWFEITGFEVQETGGNYEVWVQWRRYNLYAPDGRVIMTDSNVHEWHEFPASVDHVEAFHGWWNIGVKGADDPLGQYRAEIEIADVFSGQIERRTITYMRKVKY